MTDRMRALPLESFEDFIADTRTVAAAESYLRRALEALLDLGRHILAKGFGQAVTEYREVARSLVQVGVLTEGLGDLLRVLAGYRNRLVQFFQEISDRELYEICTAELQDLETILGAILNWIETHPEMADRST